MFEELQKQANLWIKDHFPWQFKCVTSETEFNSNGCWIIFTALFGDYYLTLSLYMPEDDVKEFQLEEERWK